MSHVESEDTRSQEKTYCSQFRCSEDQVTFLFKEIEGAYKYQQNSFASWIELPKVFDTIWIDGILVMLQRCSNGLHNTLTFVKLEGLLIIGKAISLCSVMVPLHGAWFHCLSPPSPPPLPIFIDGRL